MLEHRNFIVFGWDFFVNTCVLIPQNHLLLVTNNMVSLSKLFFFISFVSLCNEDEPKIAIIHNQLFYILLFDDHVMCTNNFFPGIDLKLETTKQLCVIKKYCR